MLHVDLNPNETGGATGVIEANGVFDILVHEIGTKLDLDPTTP